MSVELIKKHDIEELGEKRMSYNLVHSHTKDAKKFPGGGRHFPSGCSKTVSI